MGRHGNQSILVESAILSESAVGGSSDSAINVVHGEISSNEFGVESGDYIVTNCEAGYRFADFHYMTSPIGAGNDAMVEAERVGSLRNDDITVIERDCLN